MVIFNSYVNLPEGRVNDGEENLQWWWLYDLWYFMMVIMMDLIIIIRFNMV